MTSIEEYAEYGRIAWMYLVAAVEEGNEKAIEMWNKQWLEMNEKLRI